MPFVQRYSDVKKGGIVFTGNTLGLSKASNQNAPRRANITVVAVVTVAAIVVVANAATVAVANAVANAVDKTIIYYSARAASLIWACRSYFVTATHGNHRLSLT